LAQVDHKKKKGHMNQELLLVGHNHIASQDVDMEHHSYQIQEEWEVGHHCHHKIGVTDQILQQEELASFSVRQREVIKKSPHALDNQKCDSKNCSPCGLV
jgi:hypothetical protein